MKGINQRNSLFCTKSSYSMAEIEICQKCKANWSNGKQWINTAFFNESSRLHQYPSVHALKRSQSRESHQFSSIYVHVLGYTCQKAAYGGVTSHVTITVPSLGAARNKSNQYIDWLSSADKRSASAAAGTHTLSLSLSLDSITLALQGWDQIKRFILSIER